MTDTQIEQGEILRIPADQTHTFYCAECGNKFLITAPDDVAVEPAKEDHGVLPLFAVGLSILVVILALMCLGAWIAAVWSG